MSDNEFFHEALVRRIRDRDDCDDDLRGACDEIEDCYEAIERMESEIDRLRLTDAERTAIQWVVGDALSVDGVSIQETLRGLLERLK